MLRATPAILILLAGCAGMVPAEDEAPTGDDGTGHASIPSFPNVAVKGSQAADGVIEMEHMGGDCIAVPEYTFRVESDEATPRTSAVGDTAAQQFCVGDKIYVDGHEERSNEIVVIDDASDAQVYKKTIQL